jgi:hypothetical protein
MARFVPLNLRAGCLGLAAGMGAVFCPVVLRADTPMTNAAPAPVKPTATNAAGTPRPPDTFDRYGKIWAPSDDAAHPIKLNVQFPGVGEMKIPSQEELQVRDKLEQLATLSDADIHKQLDQWPPYTKMKLGDQGQLLSRIQAFRDLRTKVAMQKAHDMGLLTLTNDQKAHFEKEYWDKRLQMDHELAKQFIPVFKAREQKLEDELFREFSSIPQAPLAKNPAPPPAVPPTNNPATPPAPVVQMKDASTGQQPVAQAPH